MVRYIYNIDLIFLWLLGLFCLGSGLIVLTKRKLIFSNILTQTATLLPLLAIPLKNIVNNSIVMYEIILYTACIVFVAYITKKFVWGKYTIMNMDYERFKLDLIEVFEKQIIDNNVSCLPIGDIDTLIKRISKNSIVIDLRKYKKNDNNYIDILRLIRDVMNNHEESYLSYDGIFMVMIGLALLMYFSYKLGFTQLILTI